MRQKTELEITLQAETTGEARRPDVQGTEVHTAEPKIESRAATGPSMEAIVERNNLLKALAQVQANKGAPGIDGMSVDGLAPYLKEHWLTIRAQLLRQLRTITGWLFLSPRTLWITIGAATMGRASPGVLGSSFTYW